MNNIKIEVWKALPEFPWIEVSTFGNIRTLDRVVTRGKHKQFVKGKILKQRHNRGGYLQVMFNARGKVVNRKVHRLVAQTFLPNPDNLPQVNHKDCDRTNNCVDNLEWCDASYNRRYTEKYGVSMTEAQGKPMFAINLTTLEISHFQSQSEASRVLGIDHSDIAKVIKCKRKQTKGYWFTYADNNAIEATRDRFDDVLASKVEKLMANKELQLA